VVEGASALHLCERTVRVIMQSNLSQLQSRQIAVIARLTPHGLAGHILNTTIAAIAVAGSVPLVQLIIWCTYSYSIALILLFRHLKERVKGQERSPRNFDRAVKKVTLYAVLLAVSWSSLILLRLGAMAPDEEIILVALVVGMSASGTILLSAVPPAAFSYMSAILIPSALKCVFLFDHKSYVLLGVLAVGYWAFLAALIGKITREIGERMSADIALLESEARYRALYEDNPSMYFTVDSAGIVLSVNGFGAQQLGCTAGELVGQSVLRVIHEDDRATAQRQLALCEQDPGSVVKQEIRKVRRDGSILWVREIARAVSNAEGQTVILVVCENITERKQSEEHQRLLVAELDHRVKNMLATVSVVASRTQDASCSVADFVAAFDGRIRAMATAHELLSVRGWQGLPLAELVRRELGPYATSNNNEIDGPEVMLRAEAGQAMAVGLHELVTNAAKYGALSTHNGRVLIRWYWRLNGGAHDPLAFEWQEIGGPSVATPSKLGYGTSVIRELIPYELGGTADLTLAPEGVRCRLEIPVDCLSGGSRPDTGPALPSQTSRP
jgi:PAS domain S-box-containing protein